MDAMKDLRAFILIILVLAFVWLFTGGPLRPSSKSGWFLNRPQQKGEQRAKKEAVEVLGTKVPLDETDRPKTKQPVSSSISSSVSSPLPYFRGDDGSPKPSSSSISGAIYDNTTNNSASIVFAASKQSLSDGQRQASSAKPDFATLKTKRAKETTPDEEYVEIKADKKNKSSMKITGWKLKGKTGLNIAIGKGASYI